MKSELKMKYPRSISMNYRTSGYASHQPILEKILPLFKGNVLECGCGEGSTPLIKKYFDEENRSSHFYSLESSAEYYEKYKHLESKNHSFQKVDATTEDTDEQGMRWVNHCETQLKNIEFDLVFIDSNNWSTRKHLFSYFKNKAKIIVIHDVDYFPVNKIFGKITDTFGYAGTKILYCCDFSDVVDKWLYFSPPFDFYDGHTGPPTLVCSNLLSKEDFKQIIESATTLQSYYNELPIYISAGIRD